MLWLQNLKSESGFCWKLETLISTQQNLKYCLPQMAFNFASQWGTASPCCLKMIKNKLSTTFQVFPTLSQSFSTCCQGDLPIISVCWYVRPHRLVHKRAYELPQLFKNASCVDLQARLNGWVVSVAYTHSKFFFQDNGKAIQKSSSVA